MKIAISATEDSKVDQRFGRCSKFKIVEIEEKKVKSQREIDNSAAMQSGGAGIKAAQILGEEKVEAVITGNLGPNATMTLKQLGIKVFQAEGEIDKAIDMFLEDKLKKIEDPTVGSHGGMQR